MSPCGVGKGRAWWCARSRRGWLTWALVSSEPFCHHLHLVLVIKREEGRDWGTHGVIDALGIEMFHGPLHLAVH